MIKQQTDRDKTDSDQESFIQGLLSIGLAAILKIGSRFLVKASPIKKTTIKPGATKIGASEIRTNQIAFSKNSFLKIGVAKTR
jgi:hypothetical protein